MDNGRTLRSVFSDISVPPGAEVLSTLFETNCGRIQRIVSHDHASPPGFWYDQDDDEWVMVVRGSAVIEFDDGRLVEMAEGDYLTIPRHARHRVARTDAETIWLAVHVIGRRS
ncbi:MAG: cupin domain-containing protein [Deltaproteobacteria bacterium]|nr:cupin domain-containing protein [Deltaproteobacteria bacterium]